MQEFTGLKTDWQGTVQLFSANEQIILTAIVSRISRWIGRIDLEI